MTHILCVVPSYRTEADGISTFAKELLGYKSDIRIVESNFTSISNLLRCVFHSRILVLNGPYFWPYPLLCIFGRIIGKKTIFINHGNISILNESCKKKIFNRLFLFLIGPFINLFIVTSEAERSGLRGFPCLKMPLSVGVGVLQGPNDSSKYIGYCGRISKEKRVNVLIESFDKVACSISLQLVIAGKVQDPNCNLASGSHSFIGEVTRDQSRSISSRAYFNVNLSRSESFGYSVAESLSAGVPVIVSLESEWPVEQGFGYRVDGDDQESIKDLLRKIDVLTEHEYETLSSNAYKFYCDNYSYEIVREKWEALFETV